MRNSETKRDRDRERDVETERDEKRERGRFVLFLIPNLRLDLETITMPAFCSPVTQDPSVLSGYNSFCCS